MKRGYTITLHEAQRSQFLRRIIALQKGGMANRAWRYTAIVRAQREVNIVGTEKYF